MLDNTALVALLLSAFFAVALLSPLRLSVKSASTDALEFSGSGKALLSSHARDTRACAVGSSADRRWIEIVSRDPGCVASRLKRQ